MQQESAYSHRCELSWYWLANGRVWYTRSGLFLCTFMSKNIRFCVIICSTRSAHAQPPKESIDRYCIGVRSLNSFYGSYFCLRSAIRLNAVQQSAKKDLTSRHYFFLAHRGALCEHRSKKLQKWARLIIPWRCPLLLSLFGFNARQHCAHMATRGFICSAGGARA